MTAYVYSTRKSTRDILIAGITPITVFSIEYAYKPTRTWPGDSYHAANMRREGKTFSMSQKAANYHIEMGHQYAVWGGFEEGNTVYKIPPTLIPSTMYDDDDINVRLPGIEVVGKLYKVRGKWTVEQECPGHDWKYNTTFRGNIPGKECSRCNRTEYVDAALQAQREHEQRVQQEIAA